MKLLLLYLLTPIFAQSGTLPAKFDLRSSNSGNFVSSIKNQQGGTCWTHATMAALEGNLMMNGVWNANETGEANLAEYHLDWWNGFNQNFNPDSNFPSGLTVHQGGDYRVAAAYLALGGAVRNSDGQNFSSPPDKYLATYHYYYPRDIEWYSMPKDSIDQIDAIKEAIMNNGVMGTALTWSSQYYDSYSNTFYQPSSSNSDPNHAVAIVGWDDNKQTEASKPGAWLIKNSWGTSFGQGGYFWISYYDKIAGHHEEMGAVSFKNVERQKYFHIYSHDAHGWRETKKDISEALNVFKATDNEKIAAISFYTTQDNVGYQIKIYNQMNGQELSGLSAVQEGSITRKGFHTVDISPVPINPGQTFYVSLKLSQGGHAYDKTSDVPVLLGSKYRVVVPSYAKPGESYYKNASNQWVDLNNFDNSANFSIKALTLKN